MSTVRPGGPEDFAVGGCRLAVILPGRGGQMENHPLLLSRGNSAPVSYVFVFGWMSAVSLAPSIAFIT